MMTVKTVTVSWMLALLVLAGANLSAATLQISSGEQRVTLVELYTSEGCSSCPPAEAWLNGFLKDEDLWNRVIPVAFHVDYWDYIGWKDRFAQSRFSDRQYRYQQEGGIRTVYTPGVLLNGEEWRSWSRQRPGVADETPGALTLEVTGNHVTVRFASTSKPAGEMRLHLAILAFGLTSEIAAGENRGRQLAHEFVVVGMSASDAADLNWQMQLPEIRPTDAKRHALVAWVSEPDRLRPLQATGGWLPAKP
ncbi:DUF1223 domain-containing protein [Sedimenticola selenatireducens]|uniref:DUF1223 domain-containing protein n=1 Tax=Sedimenticola selenatireducens TaxID=191960 RepID=UPI000A06C683|nr:DUF1223 domain-containing protein [Sedimenticola selenatireducens]